MSAPGKSSTLLDEGAPHDHRRVWVALRATMQPAADHLGNAPRPNRPSAELNDRRTQKRAGLHERPPGKNTKKTKKTAEEHLPHVVSTRK